MMKKKVLIGVGWAVALITALVVIRITNIEQRASNAEVLEETVDPVVSQASRQPDVEDIRRDGGDTGQGLQEAGTTEGRTGKFNSLELSDPVKSLSGLDGKEHNYPELMQAIAALGYNLSAADVAALREMLMFPNSRFPKMRPIEVNAVKNDVLDMLLRQKELSEGLGLQMVGMAENSANDPVWRDYCVQFMEPFYERASGKLAAKNAKNYEKEDSETSVSSSAAGGEKLSDELTAVHDAMFSALDERSATIAGTALIGLELLSRSHEEFDRERIVKKAIEMALDERASSSVRLTALRLPAVVENKGLSNTEQGTSNVEVAKTARTLAQTGETVLLRSAAIVTLGEVGSAEDRELLESFTFAENKQIAEASRLALKKMDARELDKN
jgi:hypothetical protein